MEICMKGEEESSWDLVPLQGCSGIRSELGSQCPDACIAHFDAVANPRRHYEMTGEPYSTMPNSAVAWVRYLPGSQKLAGWTSKRHACVPRSSERIVNLHRNSDVFLKGDGAALAVYVVTVVDDGEGDHYSTLMVSEGAARDFFKAEVALVEDDCDCVPLPPR
jgi:hypothetical protein